MRHTLFSGHLYDGSVGNIDLGLFNVDICTNIIGSLLSEQGSSEVDRIHNELFDIIQGSSSLLLKIRQ